MKYRFFYIFFLLTVISSYAQSTMVEAQIDTTKIRIGEQFELKITVNATENVIVPKLDNLNGLEVVDSLKMDTINNRLIKKYTLTGFDSGAFYIPRQQIFIKNQAYLTDSLLVNVATVPVDTTKIKKFPIKGIKGEPYQLDDFRAYIWWAILVLIAIGALVYYFVFRRKPKVEEETIIERKPAFEEAIEQLEILDQKLLWQNNKVKAYYIELIDILRNYIGRDIEIPTLELTSNQIIELISVQNDKKTLGFDKNLMNKLEQLLRNSDLVKFAKLKPMANEIAYDRKAAEQVIKGFQQKIQEYKKVKSEENNALETFDSDHTMPIENMSLVSETKTSPNEKPKTKKSKNHKKNILLIVIAITFATAGGYVGFRLLKNSDSAFPNISLEEIAKTEWKTYTYGNPSITIDSPLNLKEEKLPDLPEGVQNLIEQSYAYSYKNDSNKLQIFLTGIVYKAGIPLDLNGAIGGSIAQINQEKNVSGLKYEYEPCTLDNIDGAKLYGSLNESGIDMEFTSYIFTQDNKMWTILLVHETGDNHAEQIIERLTKSIKIDTKYVE